MKLHDVQNECERHFTVREFCVSKTRFHKNLRRRANKQKIANKDYSFFSFLSEVLKFAVPIRLQSLSIIKRGLGNFNNNKLCPD